MSNKWSMQNILFYKKYISNLEIFFIEITAVNVRKRQYMNVKTFYNDKSTIFTAFSFAGSRICISILTRIILTHCYSSSIIPCSIKGYD